MTAQAHSKLISLKKRAEAFDKTRAFFKKRGVLEVDCPALSRGSPVDLHIDPMAVFTGKGGIRYLHTSPEYAMKRLLAEVQADIYQLTHVFRLEESSPLHNPEFTMLEWYRLGFSFEEMIEETLLLIQTLLTPLPSRTKTYREIFQEGVGIDYLPASTHDLLLAAKQHEILLPSSATEWDKDTLLQLLMAECIEPHLGNNELFVLSHFPASQSALSKTTLQEEAPTALRFEIYYQGIELANGYEELTDPSEQEERFKQANHSRIKIGKDPLPIDTYFLEAMRQGIPPCCGVAVGFDRLIQLSLGAPTLQEILPFSWDEI